MRNGSILSILTLLIILGVLAYGGFYIFNNYSQTPTKLTRDTANSIPKYSNAIVWQETGAKNLCLLKKCTQPVTIEFKSKDVWVTIYQYYVASMRNYGWDTNTVIVTSIPSSVVFTKATCKATLDQKGDAFTISTSCN